MRPRAQYACDLARSLLAEPLPRRWAHTQGVAGRAEALAPILGDDSDLLHAAAWLHDIGYAPNLAKTGFHPLDGARYLRDAEHADRRLCLLVAHHSCACIEAEERNLADVLTAEFDSPPVDQLDALTYADMTTGPGGEQVTLDGRLDEIATRYSHDDPVARAIRTAAPILRGCVDRIERRRDTLRSAPRGS